MYTSADLLEAVRKPQKAVLELNRIYNRTIRGRTGIKLMDEDWDNLLILDACRYDLFEQLNSIDGELKSVISSDSSTSGFLTYNFGEDSYPDTVYVAGNPQVQRHGVDGRFHDCIKLWEDSWDDELRTVLPEDVSDRALQAAEEYPNKRLIVHYIQPHYPFIGETGRQISHGTVTGDGVMSNKRDTKSIWEQLESGAVNRDTVWEAYEENLELVLPEAERLLDGIVGKSVVTSDHGNSFGTLGVYGHPGGTFLDSLVRVPWLETGGETRKRITRGELTESTTDTAVSDRLADLGYK